MNLEMPDFTLRNVSKHIVRAAIQMQVAQMTKNLVVDYGGFESDNKLIKIGTNVIGWGVSAHLKPHTDKVVDKTADFIIAKREARKTKQEEKTTEK